MKFYSLIDRCEQNIIDKCAEMSSNLQQRMDELIANGSVAAVRSSSLFSKCRIFAF